MAKRPLLKQKSSPRLLFCLLFIIYFQPVAIWIPYVNLFDSIRPHGYFVFDSGPIFERDVEGCNFSNESIHIGDRKAEMVVFVDGYGFAFGLNDVQRKAIADVQPGMEAIFERFVQKCKLKNLCVEFSAFLDVLCEYCNMGDFRLSESFQIEYKCGDQEG